MGKYYWLKLMNDFFTQPKIKKLRKIAGGDTYTIIYLKMQLLSLKNDGKLYFENIENNFIEEIALTIDEDVDNVAVTVQYLQSQGLIETSDNFEYLMTETQSLIGSESESAERVRRHREKKKEQKALQCNGDVTECNTEKRREELETELESEKEKKKKPVRHKYGEYNNVLLSDEDHEKLVNEFPIDYQERIERLSEYMASTGKSYKNHLATIRNWARKDKKPEHNADKEFSFKDLKFDEEGNLI